jgi:hypothetical protein
MTDDIAAAAQFIAAADGILVTAGAGMGVDSGLPDFRGDTGFWQAYPALARSRVGFSEIATPARFYTTPQVSWGFYGHRLQLYRETVPHAGFAILREIADRMPQGGFVFTSNVDGQFQKAGGDPDRVVEYHGTIHQLQCLNRCTDAILFAGLLVWSPASWSRPGLGATSTAVSDALLADAVAFIERRYVRHGRPVVYNPVSTIQREFGLGFQIAGVLVKSMEQAGIWRVCSTSAGHQAILTPVDLMMTPLR